jgi:hypothetical protein
MNENSLFIHKLALLFFFNLSKTIDVKTKKTLEPVPKLYRFKILTKFDKRKRNVWLEINTENVFDSLENLVKYYQNNHISPDHPFKFNAGIDKHAISKSEQWFVEKNDEEIYIILRQFKQPGSFLIRPSTGNRNPENGLIHLFTLIFYLNKKNLEFQKFAIAKNEESNTFWIMNQEFSSLIELVYYFKKNVLSNERTLVDFGDQIKETVQQKQSLNDFKVKINFFTSKLTIH